jgi:hypothetical protein
MRVALFEVFAVIGTLEDDELGQKPQVTKPLGFITNRQD